MRRTWPIIYCLLIIGLVAGNSSCRSNAKAARASRELATKIIQSKSTPPEDPKTATPIAEQRVYLDATISMKGFVNPTKHSTFDEFVDEIGDALPGCRLYKYGQKGLQQPDRSSELIEQASFGLELHRPDFYNLSYNPDDRLINELAKEDGSVLSVLITDGVYSEPKGSTSPPVVEAIRAWMERGRVFGVLIFKSSFNGPFYSERQRAILPSLAVPARPFYAFILSPTKQGFKDLQRKLQPRFPDMQSLLFADDSVSCLPDLDERAKGTYSFLKPPNAPYYWHMFDAALFAQKMPAPVGYHLKYNVSPEYPAADFKPDIAPEFYHWESGGFRKVEGGPPPGFLIDVEPNKESTSDVGKQNTNKGSSAPPPDFIVYYPQDSSSDYGFYYLKIGTSPKSLRQEIQVLSTRDDSIRENANKTFRFFELISALTDIHFKARLTQRTSPPIFITVTNR